MAAASTLRVLIADERADILQSLAELVRAAGHEPVACEVTVQEAASAVERARPHAAVVGMHADLGHGLDLLDALSAVGDLPLIAALDEHDDRFLADAAERGVIVITAPVSAEAMSNALRVGRSRAEELSTLAARVRRAEEQMHGRAVIERAKGVLMERHDIAEPEAYTALRRHAREERRTLTEIAEAVLRARPLLSRRPAVDDTPP